MAFAGIPEPIRDPKVHYTQLFINNEWVPSTDGSTYPVINPTTTEEICRVSEAKQMDVDKAVAAAKKAFEPGSAWRRTTPTQRGVLLNKLADLVERDRVYLASLETLNNGKVYSRVYSSDIPKSVIDFFRYFAGWTNKLTGQTLSLDEDVVAYTQHEPLGVCGAIIPWNVPLTMLAWKTAPCLAAGNTLVLKPSEQTPLTALYFASLMKEAGFPPGVFNVVQGFGATAGSALSHHMDVAKISFTGSVPVGRLIQKASAESNFKKMTLELGGKNPFIIFPDAKMCDAVEMAHAAIFSQGGQICCAGSLTYVHEEIYDEFVQKSIARAKSRKLGDPFDLAVEQGPQITQKQMEVVLGIIEDGLKKGGTLHCGGGRPKDLKGFFIEPAVITDMEDDHKLVRNEIFGPVQIILKFKSTDEVIRRCNASQYGLAAGVFTRDINNALKIANGVRAGSMWVNCFFAMRGPTPFGGYKMSGIGRDLGEESLRSYTEVKSVVIKPSTPSV